MFRHIIINKYRASTVLSYWELKAYFCVSLKRVTKLFFKMSIEIQHMITVVNKFEYGGGRQSRTGQKSFVVPGFHVLGKAA